jgi:hypothetical protein
MDRVGFSCYNLNFEANIFEPTASRLQSERSLAIFLKFTADLSAHLTKCFIQTLIFDTGDCVEIAR